MPKTPAHVEFAFYKDRVEVWTADSSKGPSTVTTVWFASRDGDATAVKVELPDGIRPSALQRFSWAQHLAMADLAWRMHHSRPPARRIAEDALMASVEKTMGAVRPAKRPGRAGHPDDFYRRIASRYQALRAAGVTNPTFTIAKEENKSRSTAAGWVRRTRELGYLPRARPGRAG